MIDEKTPIGHHAIVEGRQDSYDGMVVAIVSFDTNGSHVITNYVSGGPHIYGQAEQLWFLRRNLRMVPHD